MHSLNEKTEKKQSPDTLQSESPAPELNRKYQILKQSLSELGSVAISFSGGVDSTFLLKAAHQVLGDRVLAITVRSGLFPQRELEEAKAFCRQEHIPHIICELNELQIEGFAENPPNRCYICKSAIFQKIKKVAKTHNITNIAEGSNVDDSGDYRPGMVAVKEQDVKSPLRAAGLTKNEIRELSRQLGLSTWDKPSFACLASRFVYGDTISAEKLDRIGRAEQVLFDLGFTQVRVRLHGDVARIEIRPEEFSNILRAERAQTIYKAFLDIGFSYVTLDLLGYRTGSMNETLQLEEGSYSAKSET